LKNTTRVTASGDPVDSVFIIDDRNVAGTVNNYPYLTTNTLPSNLTKGSSIGVASAAVFGNAADFVIANWSGIEFLVDPYSSAKKGLTDIHATVYYDGGVIRPQSFSAMKDILTA
jgi:HK97 family phage major capsid protein